MLGIKGANPGVGVAAEEEITTIIIPEMEEGEGPAEGVTIMITSIAAHLRPDHPGIHTTMNEEEIHTTEVVCVLMLWCSELANCCLWLIEGLYGAA